MPTDTTGQTEAPIPVDEPLPRGYSYNEEHFQSRCRKISVNVLKHEQNDHFSEYNGIELYLVRYDDDGQWWFTPTNVDDDRKMDDIGPFPTVQVALTALRLMGGTV